MFGLPFREIWALDFEFIANSGERPSPVCMVARELNTGRVLRLWQDELAGDPPFQVADDALFIAHMASAEWVASSSSAGPSRPESLTCTSSSARRPTGCRCPCGAARTTAQRPPACPASAATGVRAGQARQGLGGHGPPTCAAGRTQASA